MSRMGREQLPPKQDQAGAAAAQDGCCRHHHHRVARELSKAPLFALKLMPCLGSALPPHSGELRLGDSPGSSQDAPAGETPRSQLCVYVNRAPVQQVLPPLPAGPSAARRRRRSSSGKMVPLQQPLVFCRRGHYRGARPARSRGRPSVPPAPALLPALPASEAGVRRPGLSPKGGGSGGGF